MRTQADLEMRRIFSVRNTEEVDYNLGRGNTLLQLDDWELNPGGIVLDEKLGEGAFGEVYKGILVETNNESQMEAFLRRGFVAIKYLKGKFVDQVLYAACIGCTLTFISRQLESLE